MATGSLLDFITALTHDPVAAAAYRADPQRALSEADLHGVTTADVNQLLPFAAESTSSVWSGTAAANSFDLAFAPSADPATDGGNDDRAYSPGTTGFDSESIPGADLPDPVRPVEAWGQAPTVDDVTDAVPPFDSGATGTVDPPEIDVPSDSLWGPAPLLDDAGADGHHPVTDHHQ